MTVVTLTATECQAKLETLASIDPDILAKTTVRELRELVRGVVTSVSKLNKTELLDHIADRTAAIREANRIALETAAIGAAQLKERNAELEAAKLSPANTEGYRNALGIESFLDTIETVKTTLDAVARKNEGFDHLCDAVDNVALKYCFEQSIAYQPTTRKSNNTELFKALDIWFKNLQGGAVDDDIKTTIARFKSKVGAINYDANKVISKEYRDSMKPRIDGLKDIAAQPLIDRAIMELENLSDYRNVAIAIAIVTGRRMAEIMAVGRFELSYKEGYLHFSGQSKTRGSTVANSTEIFDIPVLADPAIILKGIWYLEEGGYRLETTDDVNKKYSKSLSRKMVEWSEFAGVQMEFKSLRALYGSVCFQRFAVHPKKESSYLSEILGHGEKDITTSFSYMIWNVID